MTGITVAIVYPCTIEKCRAPRDREQIIFHGVQFRSEISGKQSFPVVAKGENLIAVRFPSGKGWDGKGHPPCIIVFRAEENKTGDGIGTHLVSTVMEIPLGNPRIKV